MSCCPPPCTPCTPFEFCQPENFGLAFPSLVGPMGPPGGPGTYVENYDALRAINATAFTAGYMANVGGYDVTGDGGGGVFEYDPSSAVADNDGTVLAPANGIGRWLRIYSGALYGKWFGMKADGVTPDTAAWQALINAGVGEIVLPDGDIVLDSSLDYTACLPGLITRGQGIGTVIYCSGAGTCMICCTGKAQLNFWDFRLIGDSGDTPDAAFLLARNAANASSGQHIFRNIQTRGEWVKAPLVSLSSESNEYLNVSWQNASAALNASGVIITAQNTAGVSTAFSALPATFTGGNTVHRFIGGDIRSYGSATGRDMWLETIRDISLHGTFFSQNAGASFAGIYIAEDVDSLHLVGCSAEWIGTHGVYVAAAKTLINSSFHGTFSGDFYGADTSVVKNCFLWGPFFGIPAIDAYDMIDCYVSVRNLGVDVRNKMHGCTIPGSQNQTTDYSFPSDVLNNQEIYSFAGGDGITRGYANIANEAKGRLVTNVIKSKFTQKVGQSPVFAPSFTPTLNNGGLIYLTQTANTTINGPTLSNYNPDPTLDGDGMEMLFILKQDGTGGRTITFDAAFYDTDWAPNLDAGAVNCISFIYSTSSLLWVQKSTSFGKTLAEAVLKGIAADQLTIHRTDTDATKYAGVKLLGVNGGVVSRMRASYAAGLAVGGGNIMEFDLGAAIAAVLSLYEDGSGALVAHTSGTRDATTLFASNIMEGGLLLKKKLALSTYADGSLSVASGIVVSSSDRRLKIVGAKFRRGLDAILALQPRLYRWRRSSGVKSDKKFAGFIAQEVQQAIPEAVSAGKNGMLGLDDRPIIAALVNAVQELHAEVERLKKNR